MNDTPTSSWPYLLAALACPILPGACFLFGWCLYAIPLPPTLSNYYHTPLCGPLVGVLSLGALGLFAIRGRDRTDRRLARTGGLVLALVAWVPTRPLMDYSGWDQVLGHLHNLAAMVLFGLMIAFVWRPGLAGPPLAAEGRQHRLRRLAALVMGGCLAGNVALTIAAGPLEDLINRWRPMFVLEWLALMAFAVACLLGVRIRPHCPPSGPLATLGS